VEGLIPDEKFITEIETIFRDIVELGAKREYTRLAPNLLVRNPSPAGQPNFILVKDDRDGDNILALKVPGIVYNTNDLVNVLFYRGGEAIAFQQGSGSSSSGIWGIIPATTTDIFYNAGDVSIGKASAPDARLELVDSAQVQLRLTHTDATKFADLSVDTNHDFTINPSSTGQIVLAAVDVTMEEDLIHAGDTDTKITFTDDDVEIAVGGLSLLKLTETAQDLITLGPGSGDVDINFNGDMFLRGSDGYFGIGNAAPTTTLDVTGTETITDDLVHAGDTDTKLSFTDDDVEITVGGLSLLKLTETAQDLITLGPGSGDVDINFNGDMFLRGSDGYFGIGTAAPLARLHGYDTIGGFIQGWVYDLDATTVTIVPNGTGDCLYRLHAEYVFRASGAATASGTTDVSNSAFVDLVVGGNTVRLNVNADGSIDVARTTGVATIKVIFNLLWL